MSWVWKCVQSVAWLERVAGTRHRIVTTASVPMLDISTDIYRYLWQYL